MQRLRQYALVTGQITDLQSAEIARQAEQRANHLLVKPCAPRTNSSYLPAMASVARNGHGSLLWRRKTKARSMKPLA